MSRARLPVKLFRGLHETLLRPTPRVRGVRKASVLQPRDGSLEPSALRHQSAIGLCRLVRAQ